MKIRPLEAELFRAERQTKRRTNRYVEAKSRFRNFAKAPKTYKI